MPAPHTLSRSLFLLTDPTAGFEAVLAHVRAGIRGGVTHVVVRRPEDSAEQIYRLSRTVDDLTGESGVRLLVNDRVDVALSLSGTGAHLGGRSLPAMAARPLLDGRLMGVSVHSRQHAYVAKDSGADYLLFGHVYETRSHPGEPGRGLEALREVVSAVDIPVIAIGGITADRVDEVLATGAAGVAVIRGISDARDPESSARAFREALDAASYPRQNSSREES